MRLMSSVNGTSLSYFPTGSRNGRETELSRIRFGSNRIVDVGRDSATSDTRWKTKLFAVHIFFLLKGIIIIADERSTRKINFDAAVIFFDHWTWKKKNLAETVWIDESLPHALCHDFSLPDTGPPPSTREWKQLGSRFRGVRALNSSLTERSRDCRRAFGDPKPASNVSLRCKFSFTASQGLYIQMSSFFFFLSFPSPLLSRSPLVDTPEAGWASR